MAEVLKVLGQIVPVLATLTDLYTVPALTSTTVSSVTVANQNATPIKFRISVAAAGAADATKQYLYYDGILPGNSTFAATLGLTLGAADVVRVRSDTGLTSFNLFGVEVS